MQANLAVSEARLGVAVRELQEAQSKLDEKEAELRKVQELYDAAMTEKQALLDDAEACKRKMIAASELIGGLAGEKIRWTNQSKEFKASIDRSVCLHLLFLCTHLLAVANPEILKERAKDNVSVLSFIANAHNACNYGWLSG